MLIKVYSAAILGIDAVPITVEVNTSRGMDYTLVGLPDNAVKESRERISSALHESGFNFPHCTLVVNMAPADIKKEGAAYDLTLAIAVLAADEQLVSQHLSEYMIMGELSLDGHLKPISGVLPMALCARDNGFKGFILPSDNAREAAVVKGIDVIAADHILDVVRFLSGDQLIEPTQVENLEDFAEQALESDSDFSDVRGQYQVRRALEVAAAGGHNLLMVGPPGAGKSMMAKRLPTILPPLTLEESLETTKIHSVAGLMTKHKGHETSIEDALIVRRPFRSPHHTITDVALVGGGASPRPGEISLAHNGVLFLDELPEYKRSALEVMRQPLEDRTISISRARMSISYPAGFMLVAAMNPCPCGYYGDPVHACTCTAGAVHRYLRKISGPLLDRIDIQVPIQAVGIAELQSTEPGESSAAMRARVLAARAIQRKRFENDGQVHCNAQMNSRLMRKYCTLTPEVEQMLASAMVQKGFSARAYDRILKVARTIADLEAAPQIMAAHVAEALSYREVDTLQASV